MEVHLIFFIIFSQLFFIIIYKITKLKQYLKKIKNNIKQKYIFKNKN